MPAPLHDLLDRHAAFGKRQNSGIGLLAPEVPFILEPLGRSEQLGVDQRRADRGTDRLHGFAHGAKERRAGVLDEVPAIDNLDNTSGRAFAVASPVKAAGCDGGLSLITT